MRSALSTALGHRAANSVAVAIGFWLVCSAIVMLRDQLVRYRLGQYVHQDVPSRVEFESRDLDREQQLKQQAREAAPRVYRRIEKAFDALERQLLALPEQALQSTSGELSDLASGTVTKLKSIAQGGGADGETLENYQARVKSYIAQLKASSENLRLIVLPYEGPPMPDRKHAKIQAGGGSFVEMELGGTFTRRKNQPPAEPDRGRLLDLIKSMANATLDETLAASLAGFTVNALPVTHELDEAMTQAEQKEAEKISLAPARRHVVEKSVLAPKAPG